MDSLEREDFHLVGRYKTPLLYQSLCFPTLSTTQAETLGILSLDGGLSLDGYEFMRKNEWQAIAREAETAVKREEFELLERYFHLARSATRRLVESSERMRSSTRLTPEKFAEFAQTLRRLEIPWWSTLPIGEGMEAQVAQMAKASKYPVETVARVFRPSRPTLMMQQNDDIASIRLEWEAAGKDDESVAGLISAHVKKFHWVGMLHFWGEPLSVGKALEQMKAGSTKQNIPGTNPIPGDFENIAPIAGELCYWRQHCAEACAIASHDILPKFEQASQERGKTYAQTMWLTAPEFQAMLAGEAIPDDGEIRARGDGYGLNFEESPPALLTGNPLATALDAMMVKTTRANEVRGKTANPGKAAGTARIILTPRDAEKMVKGEILVASETTPDFMAAIFKAAAIVTDQGGITSHAAVVAREFGIPCVVGTKIATRAFQDGDILEVDAENGIIRKLGGKG